MADGMQKSAAECGGSAELEAVRQQLKGLAAALERLVAAESAGALETARAEARKFFVQADSAMEKLLLEAGDVKASAAAGRSQLEKAVRAKPMLAVGLAAATGFLLASLLRRPRA